MKWKFKPIRSSYTQKIMLVISAIVLAIALCLSLISWKLSSRHIYILEKEILRRSADNAYNQISISLDMAKSLTTQIVRSDALLEITHSRQPSEHAEAELKDTLENVISTAVANTTATIQFVNVYLKNGSSYYTLGPNYLPYRTYEDCIQAIDACTSADLSGYVPTCWFDDQVIFSQGRSTRCLIGMRFIYEDVSLDKIGVIVVGIKQSGLQDLYSSLPSDCYIIRSDGVIISATHSSDIGKTYPYIESVLLHGSQGSATPETALPEGEALVYRISGGISWLVCPVDEYSLSNNEAILQYSKQVFYVTAAALLLTLLLSWVSSKGLTRSLKRLTGVVQRVQANDLSVRFQTDATDEIAYLGRRINDMLDQVEEFYRSQEMDAAEKRDLQLQVMQAQINPHLLYNTLNSALWIIRQGNTKKAETLILSMGSFFKLALSMGSEEIALGQEIAMIQYYLQLQNLARGKSFSLRDEVPEELRSCGILRLTLQPLVENSVIHGFSDWRDDGEIAILARADVEADRLELEVRDNGIGILPEDLSELLEDLQAYPPTKEHKHYGLYNIERRIKNKYGKEYGIAIDSEVGDYTSIFLTLPLHRREET